MKNPSVFISYSWDSKEHKIWVKNFGDFLESKSITVFIDQDDLFLGDSLTEYMESKIRESDFILIICTPKYKEKSDSRIGGVGYEGDIITGEIFSSRNNRKFIPILREGTWQISTPSWLKGKMGVDFTGNEYKIDEVDNLVATITNTKRLCKNNGVTQNQYVDDKENVSTGLQSNLHDEIRIKGIIVNEVSMPRLDGSKGSALYSIPFRLSTVPSSIWVEIFLENWRNPQSFTTMHRPRIASVLGDKIILDGTTIEEVEKYHKATLENAVQMANIGEKEFMANQRRIVEQQAKTEKDHYDRVNELASKIKF
jgi:predicted nucleotide-binding protein